MKKTASIDTIPDNRVLQAIYLKDTNLIYKLLPGIQYAKTIENKKEIIQQSIYKPFPKNTVSKLFKKIVTEEFTNKKDEKNRQFLAHLLFAMEPNIKQEIHHHFSFSSHIAKLCPELIPLCIERGMDINYFNPNLNTFPLLHTACYYSPQLVEFLLEKGADPNIWDKNQLNLILSLSTNSGEYPEFVEVMKPLIKSGIDIDFRDKEGMSPLMKAVQTKSNVVAKFLIEQGADLYITTFENPKNVLSFAIDHNPKALSYLIEKDNAISNKNNTILGSQENYTYHLMDLSDRSPEHLVDLCQSKFMTIEEPALSYAKELNNGSLTILLQEQTKRLMGEVAHKNLTDTKNNPSSIL